jgi:hypothetical protein
LHLLPLRQAYECLINILILFLTKNSPPILALKAMPGTQTPLSAVAATSPAQRVPCLFHTLKLTLLIYLPICIPCSISKHRIVISIIHIPTGILVVILFEVRMIRFDSIIQNCDNHSTPRVAPVPRCLNVHMPQVLVFIVLKDVCRVLPILEVLLDVPHRVI